MKDIYPEYADNVALYAVGTDPSESLARLEAYREDQGYPWPVAEVDRSVISDFRVVIPSTKVAFDGDGIIVYRDGYSGGNEGRWIEVFEQLSGG